MPGLTPGELRELAEARRRVETRAWDRTAWLAALLLNALAGKPGQRVTAQDLLGRPMLGAENVRRKTKDEAEAERRAILDRLSVVGEKWPTKS